MCIILTNLRWESIDRKQALLILQEKTGFACIHDSIHFSRDFMTMGHRLHPSCGREPHHTSAVLVRQILSKIICVRFLLIF